MYYATDYQIGQKSADISLSWQSREWAIGIRLGLVSSNRAR